MADVNKRVGIDLVEISRFEKPSKAFLKKVFTEAEIEYCGGFADPAPHFAGLFAAKEAASKALGTERYPVLLLEVRHKKSGAPEVWCRGKRLAVSISITHTDTIAAAVALG